MLDFLRKWCYNITRSLVEKGERDMELRIERCKEKEHFEEFCSRKFWELLDAPFIKDHFTQDARERGRLCFVITSKQEIEELISIATHYRNYWGTYDDVSKLCEVRDDFDEMTQNEHWVYIIEIVWSD